MVTLNQVRKMMNDRPQKFTEADVDFHKEARYPKESCGNCFHFYRGLFRNVCEIFRPEGDSGTSDTSISPGADCDFWTGDGEKYPKFHGAE